MASRHLLCYLKQNPIVSNNLDGKDGITGPVVQIFYAENYAIP